jgi:two-component system cell cycle sensor histidine kinase/response regulator CckA
MDNRILIVEDHGLIALDLKKKLEAAGYVVTAIDDNGADALSSIERLRPSLVLMDIWIRGQQDGIEIAEQIRRRFRVPVIFVTGHGDRRTLDRAKLTDPAGFIAKPFESVNFADRIEQALSRHKTGQELRTLNAWLSTLSTNVADALIGTEQDGRVAFLNPAAAKLTGWQETEALRKPLSDVLQLFYESTDLPVRFQFDMGIDGSASCAISGSFKMRKKNAWAPQFIEAEFFTSRDEDFVLGTLVVFRDVAAQRTTSGRDLELKRLDDLSRIATNVGIELAESIGRMEAFLREARLEPGDSLAELLFAATECLTDQRSLAARLTGLRNSDLASATLVDPNSFLGELAADFPEPAMKLTLAPGVPLVQGDGVELREITLGLIADVRKAMPGGGEVHLSTRTLELPRGAPGTQIAIRGTARYEKPDVRKRVYDLRDRSASNQRPPGPAALRASRFMARHGGHIDVDGEPGAVASYVLSFPPASGSASQFSPGV